MSELTRKQIEEARGHLKAHGPLSPQLADVLCDMALRSLAPVQEGWACSTCPNPPSCAEYGGCQLTAAPASPGWVSVPEPRGMQSVLQKVGARLLKFYSNRFALVEPVLHTDIERQVLVAALETLSAAVRSIGRLR